MKKWKTREEEEDTGRSVVTRHIWVPAWHSTTSHHEHCLRA